MAERSLNFEKLSKTVDRFVELESLLGKPEIVSDQDQYQKLAKEFSFITPLVETYRYYQDIQKQIVETKQMISDAVSDNDMRAMAEAELDDLKNKNRTLTERLAELSNPQNNEKDRDIIMEIRAGTGGLEAGLFAADLYRMYTKYAAQYHWKIDPISLNENENGGIKEIIYSVSGPGASKRLKWEGGVHRVQRVPETESSGRIHTSAATVAVMFEPEEVELEINPDDLRIDVFRASGPGGQSVNTTDSAVRITHIPTGIVVSQQDEKSQLKNKNKAMRVLRARLGERMRQEAAAKESAERKAMVGSGDRSEKIRTYNFPERRVTDHRINFTVHKLEQILNGALDELTSALLKAEYEKLQELDK